MSNPAPSQPWIILATVSIGTFMATLDASSVNVALPTIARDFAVPIPQVSWVAISYFLVLTALLPTIGRLSDLSRRSLVYCLGMGLFAIASALCALSPNLGWLVFLRGFEAVGGAMIMANSPALIASTFPDNQRGRALGTVTLVATVGSSVGPSLGGLITATIGWHGLFLLNLPIGLTGAFLGWRLLRNVHQAEPATRLFDRFGGLLSAVSLGALILTAREGPAWPPLLAWGLGTLSVTGLIGFVLWELRHSAPLIQPRLFRQRAFASATFSSLLSFCSRSGSFFLLPFFLEQYKHLQPTTVGMLMASFPVAVAFLAPLAGSLADRLGTRGLTVGGLLITTLALGMMAMAQPQTPIHWIVALHALLGVGSALFTPPNNSEMLGAVEADQLGMASGVLAVMRNLGLMLGTSMVSLILTLRPGDFMGGFHWAFVASSFFALLAASVASIRAIKPPRPVPQPAS